MGVGKVALPPRGVTLLSDALGLTHRFSPSHPTFYILAFDSAGLLVLIVELLACVLACLRVGLSQGFCAVWCKVQLQQCLVSLTGAFTSSLNSRNTSLQRP